MTGGNIHRIHLKHLKLIINFFKLAHMEQFSAIHGENWPGDTQ